MNNASLTKDREMINLEKTTFTNELSTQFLSFVETATSPFHVVKSIEEQLQNNGFEALDFNQTWKLSPGKAYYSIPYGTTLFAFRTPDEISENSAARIIASHIDQPCFKIKPSADVKEHSYHKLNIEAYGGAILNTWLDRPLSIAGKVALRSDHIFSPEVKLIDVDQPLLTIPNLAIHMNKKVNSGVELNKQVDLLPIFSLCSEFEEEDFTFTNYLAEILKVSEEDILDYDLYVYSKEQGCILGAKNELYSCPRIDNLSSVYAQLQALLRGESSEKDFLISIFYDNEEIGSKTKQGADSMLAPIFLKKLLYTFGYSDSDICNFMMNSFLISTDVAHATHPNHRERHDITNLTRINHGVAIKINGNQRYASDTEAIAVIQQICETYAIPYQKYVNRSDIAGGSTLGTILSSWLPIKTVDLGIPILAMHSIRETAGTKDEISLMRLLHAFYSCEK